MVTNGENKPAATVEDAYFILQTFCIDEDQSEDHSINDSRYSESSSSEINDSHIPTLANEMIEQIWRQIMSSFSIHCDMFLVSNHDIVQFPNQSFMPCNLNTGRPSDNIFTIPASSVPSRHQQQQQYELSLASCHLPFQLHPSIIANLTDSSMAKNAMQMMMMMSNQTFDFPVLTSPEHVLVKGLVPQRTTSTLNVISLKSTPPAMDRSDPAFQYSSKVQVHMNLLGAKHSFVQQMETIIKEQPDENKDNGTKYKKRFKRRKGKDCRNTQSKNSPKVDSEIKEAKHKPSSTSSPGEKIVGQNHHNDPNFKHTSTCSGNHLVSSEEELYGVERNRLYVEGNEDNQDKILENQLLTSRHVDQKSNHNHKQATDMHSTMNNKHFVKYPETTSSHESFHPLEEYPSVRKNSDSCTSTTATESSTQKTTAAKEILNILLDRHFPNKCTTRSCNQQRSHQHPTDIDSSLVHDLELLVKKELDDLNHILVAMGVVAVILVIALVFSFIQILRDNRTYGNRNDSSCLGSTASRRKGEKSPLPTEIACKGQNTSVASTEIRSTPAKDVSPLSLDQRLFFEAEDSIPIDNISMSQAAAYNVAPCEVLQEKWEQSQAIRRRNRKQKGVLRPIDNLNDVKHSDGNIVRNMKQEEVKHERLEVGRLCPELRSGKTGTELPLPKNNTEASQIRDSVSRSTSPTKIVDAPLASSSPKLHTATSSSQKKHPLFTKEKAVTPKRFVTPQNQKISQDAATPATIDVSSTVASPPNSFAAMLLCRKKAVLSEEESVKHDGRRSTKNKKETEKNTIPPETECVSSTISPPNSFAAMLLRQKKAVLATEESTTPPSAVVSKDSKATTQKTTPMRTCEIPSINSPPNTFASMLVRQKQAVFEKEKKVADDSRLEYFPVTTFPRVGEDENDNDNIGAESKHTTASTQYPSFKAPSFYRECPPLESIQGTEIVGKDSDQAQVGKKEKDEENGNSVENSHTTTDTQYPTFKVPSFYRECPPSESTQAHDTESKKSVQEMNNKVSTFVEDFW